MEGGMEAEGGWGVEIELMRRKSSVSLEIELYLLTTFPPISPSSVSNSGPHIRNLPLNLPHTPIQLPSNHRLLLTF